MMKFTEAELIELESAVACRNDVCLHVFCPRAILLRLIAHARQSGAVENPAPFPNWRYARKVVTDPQRISLMGCSALGGRVETFQREPISKPSPNGEPKQK